MEIAPLQIVERLGRTARTEKTRSITGRSRCFGDEVEHTPIVGLRTHIDTASLRGLRQERTKRSRRDNR